MGTWEERMSAKAQARIREEQAAAPDPDPFPEHLAAELPAGATDDEPRHWCSRCGLADAPRNDSPLRETPPCPNCGSRWRWFGRIADRDGTANTSPAGECSDCYEWRSYSEGQRHFGWTWWLICREPSARDFTCRYGHAHHDKDVWYG